MNQYEFRAIFLPYCMQRLADGRYIVLNRRYKPLGIASEDWVEYESHPSAVGMKISTALAKKISWNASADTETIYLYDDGCNPRLGGEHSSAYFKRLVLLMPLLVQAQ